MTEIRMGDEVAPRVTRRFRRTRESLDGARADLRGIADEIIDAAGELAQHIDDESRDFQSSWRAVLDVYADSAALIARNTNAQHLDLSSLDSGSAD